MVGELLARVYVNLKLRFPRQPVPAVIAGVLVLFGGVGADAQRVPDDDLPPAPLELVEDLDKTKSDVRAVTVNPNGSVPGIPQAGGPGWVSQGPAPALVGQVENVGPDLDGDGLPDDEVTGAVHVVLPHPADPNVVYVGAVNGGVWKTTNALSPSPTWVPLTDFMPSLSIGALEFDPTDPTHQTLVAGVGRFSSFGRVGGALTGLYKTVDGGASWTHLGGTALAGQNISAVYARGNVIMAASSDYRPSPFTVNVSNSGIYRSTDGGQTFQHLGTLPGPTTFRTGAVFDMEGHPNDPATVFAAVVFANTVDGNGVYRSDDFGVTWTRVSNSRMNDLMTDGSTSNVELSFFDDGSGAQVVYCAILGFGQLDNGGVFRTTNRGVTWAELPVPVTNETGGEVSTNPTFKPDAGIPGGQGIIHFSIEADPVEASVVYVGGDRQPAGAGDCCGFPNAIGAQDFTGRLFRGDLFSNLVDKWSHLTHASGVITKPLGGTASVSAPHADSREMAIDANGELIEGDDGGAYRRTLPLTNQGDWFSLNGNLAVTEMHDVAWDAVSKVVVSGNQDTGTTYQAAPGSTTWISFRTGDGGDVLIDDQTALGSSTRYSSFQSLGNPRRSVWLPSNVLLSDESMAGSGYAGQPQFRTPLALNQVDTTRLVASSSVVINESFNRGNNFSQAPLIIGVSFVEFEANALDFGGQLDGQANPDLLWAGGVAGSFNMIPVPNVLVRPSMESGMLVTNYPGRGASSLQRQPVDLEMDPDDGRICYVADQFGDVLRTTDLGVSWEDVSVALGDVGQVQQIEFVRTATSRYLAVCADLGVFYTDIGSLEADPALARWRELGTNLPNAAVWDIEYEEADDLIAIGTMGRGAWTFTDISAALDPVFPRAAVYVDRAFQGASLGTEGAPFRTIGEALPHVFAGGTIFIAPGEYLEAPVTLSKRVRIAASGPGVARIR